MLKSRKVKFALICLATILLGFAGCLQFSALAAIYSTLVGGVVGLYGIYCGANTGATYLFNKTQISAVSKSEDSVFSS